MKRPTIIAEIANAHQGSVDEALDLALMSLNSTNIDGVKFQVYCAEELLTKSHARYQHFKNQSFSQDQWREVFRHFSGKDRSKIYCDVFGIASAKLAVDNGVTKLKIHTSDISNAPLLDLINECSIEHVLISSGGCTGFEIADAIKRLDKPKRLTLMHGFQSYPTNPEDINLRRIHELIHRFHNGADVGYQDHSAGDSPEATLLPLLAISAGAVVIEKHITRDRSAKGTDYYSSFEIDELKDFCWEVDRVFSFMGVDRYAFSDAEHHYRNTVKKQWVATKKLYAGNEIRPEDITLKRVADGKYHNLDYSDIIGKRAIQDIREDETVSRMNLAQSVVATILVRSTSSRLPRKAYLKVGNSSAIEHLILRVKQSKKIDRIVLCTTTCTSDDELCAIARRNNIDYYRGEELDVLGRILQATNENENTVVRITGDDILVDPCYLDKGVDQHLSAGVDYTSMKSLPSGTEAEYFSRKALANIHTCCEERQDTEYLTYFISRNLPHFSIQEAIIKPAHQSNWRLTLDTNDDYAIIKGFIDAMVENGKEYTYTIGDINDYFEGFDGIDSIFDYNRKVAHRDIAVNSSLLFERLFAE